MLLRIHVDLPFAVVRRARPHPGADSADTNAKLGLAHGGAGHGGVSPSRRQKPDNSCATWTIRVLATGRREPLLISRKASYSCALVRRRRLIMTADNHPLTTKGIMSRRTIIQGSALLGAASTLADGAPAHGAA